MVPEPLQQLPWYWVLNALQVLLVAIMAWTSILYEVMVAGLADAVALFQTRLDRYCQQHISGCEGQGHGGRIDSEQGRRHHDKHDAVDEGKLAGGQSKGIRASKVRVWAMDEVKIDRPHHGSVSPLQFALEPSVDHPAPLPDLELHLTYLRDIYRSVRRLSSDACAFCSVPSLSLYVCVTLNILLHSYIAIIMYGSGGGEHFAGRTNMFMTGSTVCALRLMVVSCAGSRLLRSGHRLRQTLSELRWPVHTSAAARDALHLLLEQTRRPAAFDVWDLFTMQKKNVLSLFSFVLTYFVIMLQMNVG